MVQTEYSSTTFPQHLYEQSATRIIIFHAEIINFYKISLQF
jgi:hypothetical protein